MMMLRGLRLPIAVGLFVLALSLSPAPASADPGITTRVSVPNLADQATLGTQADSDSRVPAMSADGRFVAFHSLATNLVPDDTNGVRDVFVHDRQMGTTELVSVDSAGVEGNGDSGGFNDVTISDDGRFVAFSSIATELVTDDNNGKADVFVHDRQMGTTELVSVDSAGVQGNLNSNGAAISGDGLFVAFRSSANLEPGTGTFGGLFVHDRPSGTTERVSLNIAGVQTQGSALLPILSSDGRFVAFLSNATDLVTGDTNGKFDVFVRDRQMGTTARVSVSSAGGEGNGDSGTFGLDMSRDGRFVAFDSFASNLVPGDTSSRLDVFVHDRDTDANGTFDEPGAVATTRISVDSAGVEANGQSQNPAISDSGRLIAFQSLATNLVPGDTTGAADIFVHDRQTGATTTVSVDTAGVHDTGQSRNPDISADGRFVAFDSGAPNLVAGDTNGKIDVFVHDRGPLIINVTIDIKPGSDPNCVNTGGNGVIPVAILTTPTFNAAEVDPLTVTLLGGAIRLNGKSGNAGSRQDVDSDGDLDRVIQVIDFSLSTGETTAILSGITFGGTPIEGADAICVVP